jgi:hypothetical protein
MRFASRIVRFLPALFCFAASLAFSSRALAEENPVATQPEKPAAEAKTAWVRMERVEKKPMALQTAIVRYRPADGDAKGPTVDLIAAIHVGDVAYYEGLNEEFKQYDALLYELVAPKGTKIPKGGKASSNSGIGALQNGLKNVLNLEHQLEKVDYTAENFVHADMSPDEFTKKMEERDESFFKLFWRIMAQGMASQSKNSAAFSDVDLIVALFSKDRTHKLKTMMAEQFAGMETMMDSLGGPDGSTIITERNKVALEVLKAELAQGRTKVGIFYGAGHMNDMDERLRNEFKLVPTETRWLSAWNLQPKSPRMP